ncbi:MAG: phosphate ABC transporter ATP-binding protein PstB [Dehalococcoidia bacterium]|nr:phosphate ABC transporter ATP-binding protein PstB [Dehalococcoidia bacterium]
MINNMLGQTVRIEAADPKHDGDKTTSKYALTVEDLNAWYGNLMVIQNISMGIGAQRITALIGPSGCGKSTFIRCLNRMHEVSEGGRVTGRVFMDGQDIYAPQVDPVSIRRRIGMVFQRASVFPTMSIFGNVASGISLTRFWSRRRDLKDVVERSLRKAALWEEVKDKLDQPGASLSGGQQQRLCIARAIAIEPEIILMDEPCSALDPISTLRIEELMLELKKDYTVVIVTHNMQQAARVSAWTGFMLLGQLIEYAPTKEVFTVPKDKRTEDYITGRFG